MWIAWLVSCFRSKAPRMDFARSGLFFYKFPVVMRRHCGSTCQAISKHENGTSKTFLLLLVLLSVLVLQTNRTQPHWPQCQDRPWVPRPNVPRGIKSRICGDFPMQIRLSCRGPRRRRRRGKSGNSKFEKRPRGRRLLVCKFAGQFASWQGCTQVSKLFVSVSFEFIIKSFSSRRRVGGAAQHEETEKF